MDVSCQSRNRCTLFTTDRAFLHDIPAMRVAVVCLCVVVACASAETCHRTRDCDHVTCPENDYSVACEKNECTCVHVAGHCLDIKCTVKNDCRDCKCHHHNLEHHCVDNVCHCGNLPIGK